MGSVLPESLPQPGRPVRHHSDDIQDLDREWPLGGCSYAIGSTPQRRPGTQTALPTEFSHLSDSARLSQSRGIAEGVRQVLEEYAREFHRVCGLAGQPESLVGPELTADQSQSIRKGEVVLARPSRE